MKSLNTDDLAMFHLNAMNKELAKVLEGSCIFINCAMLPPLDDGLRIVIEQIAGQQTSKTEHLIVMLETRGGVMETVERMVSVIRSYYNNVSFIIPNYAYSAGTVFALSGDTIFMDYYSVLGPIDPQYNDGGDMLPGQGYLSKFQELLTMINQADDFNKVKAESYYLTQKFDPARLFHIEQAVKHGITLIGKWLPKYKFKNWEKTETTETKVTDGMKKKRAENIAKVLGDASKWHSHGRGISMEELMSDEIKLKIDDFGKKEALNQVIRNYYGLCIDFYTIRQGWNGYIHTELDCKRIF